MISGTLFGDIIYYITVALDWIQYWVLEVIAGRGFQILLELFKVLL